LKIPFEFGLFQNSGQLSALSHPLKDKSKFTTEAREDDLRILQVSRVLTAARLTERLGGRKMFCKVRNYLAIWSIELLRYMISG
jgi:hypothetical protein